MSENRQACIVFVTVSSEDEGSKIARALIEERLAACVQILPEMISVYAWQGEIETSRERLLLIKTFADAFERLSARVRELHSYDTPEIIAVDAAKVDEKYLRWMNTVAG